MKAAVLIGVLVLALAAAALYLLLQPDRAAPAAGGPPDAAEADRESRPATGLSAVRGRVTADRSPRTPLRPGPRRASEGAILAGRVIDDDELPIAGASVTVSEPRSGAKAEGARVARVTSDADGRFETAALDASLVDVLGEAPGFGWRMLRNVRVAPDRDAGVLIALSPRPQRLGRVLTESGEPVAGAEVLIRFGVMQGFGSSNLQAILRTSAEDGRFQFEEGAEPGMAPVRLDARKPGVGAASLGPTDLHQATGVVSVWLHPTRVLRITFTCQDGGPVPAELGFRASGATNFEYSGTADRDGRAVIEEFPKLTSVSIGVTSPGWRNVPKFLAGLVFSGDLEVTVPLVRQTVDPAGAPGVVEGVVVDSTDRPVQGLTVQGILGVPSGEQSPTDAQGRFRVSGVTPAKNAKVGARRGRGPVTWSPAFDLAPGGKASGVRIVVGEAPELVVDVIGADGLRAAAVVVVVEDADDGSPDRGRTTATTDPNGHCEFRGLAWENVVVSVDPGSVSPGIRPEDGFKGQIFLSPFAGSPSLTIRLRPESVIDGTVVLEDGSSPGEGTVECSSPDGKVRKFVKCDAQGQFRLRAASLYDYSFDRLTRIARGSGSSPRIEVFQPAGRAPLKPGAENRVAVQRKPE